MNFRCNHNSVLRKPGRIPCVPVSSHPSATNNHRVGHDAARRGRRAALAHTVRRHLLAARVRRRRVLPVPASARLRLGALLRARAHGRGQRSRGGHRELHAHRRNQPSTADQVALCRHSHHLFERVSPLYLSY